MAKKERDLVGPVEKAAQREMRETAALLLEKAARLEKHFRKLRRSDGYRQALSKSDHLPSFVPSVAWDCTGACEIAAESLREDAELLAKCAEATPRSLAAEARERERRSRAFKKREAAEAALKSRQERAAKRREQAILRRAEREAEEMLVRVRRLRPAVDGCTSQGRAVDVQLGLESAERQLAGIAAPKAAA